MLGLGSVGREARDEGFQFGYFFFSLSVVRGLLFARLRGRQHVFVVGAGVGGDLAVVEISHVRAHAVQKMAVMRNDDHGAVARVECIFQPADGVDIEVIGRLVQQQNVGIGKQRLRQQYTQFESGRNSAHRPLM